EDGTPFFWTADTAWLLHKLSRESLCSRHAVSAVQKNGVPSSCCRKRPFSETCSSPRCQGPGKRSSCPLRAGTAGPEAPDEAAAAVTAPAAVPRPAATPAASTRRRENPASTLWSVLPWFFSDTASPRSGVVRESIYAPLHEHAAA